MNNTIYNDNLYIDRLINQCFSILPLFEENGMDNNLQKKIDNIFHRCKGFFHMNQYESETILNILSILYSLKSMEVHGDIRHNVLKVCNLLSEMKVVVNQWD